MFTTELLLHTSAWWTATEAAKFPNQTVSSVTPPLKNLVAFQVYKCAAEGSEVNTESSGIQVSRDDVIAAAWQGDSSHGSGASFSPSLQAWTGNGWVGDTALIKAPPRTEPLHFTVLLMLLRSISVTVSRWVTPGFQFAANSAFNLSRASTFMMSPWSLVTD